MSQKIDMQLWTKNLKHILNKHKIKNLQFDISGLDSGLDHVRRLSNHRQHLKRKKDILTCLYLLKSKTLRTVKHTTLTNNLQPNKSLNVH